jgi:glutamyl-tRNA synthetase
VKSYRGRLAPSPTGYLHLGHARTFWTAQERAEAHGGTLILRNDDLDPARCRPEFVAAMFEDLRWFGLRWSEGPEVSGPHAPYDQSARLSHYRAVFERLRAGGHIYPCACSRQDVLRALTAPHRGDDEPIYPGTCRPPAAGNSKLQTPNSKSERAGVNWRFRIPDGDAITFLDGQCGTQSAVAGVDFGDFLIWRKDDLPSYQLACAADDAAMGITEVVRGEDLIASTFRQLLVLSALQVEPPAYFHCPLVTDTAGVRLAKRSDALSLRTLRAAGRTPEELRAAPCL